MELDLQMEIAADEDVQASSSSTVHSQQIVVPGCSRKLSADDCIFCFGTAAAHLRQQDRLVIAGAEGLRTIKSHCDPCRDAVLLAYIDTNVDKPILYHNICKSSHVRNYKKRSADVEITPEMEASPVKSRLRSESAFQWKKNCFLCGGECLPNDAYYRKVEKSMVEGQDRAMMVDTSIRHAIVERDRDAWAREVSGRIAGCNDLFAVEAVYHYICLVRFTSDRSKQPGEVLRGRPVNLAAVDAFSNLCDYLETSCDQKLYTMKQLHETMTYLAGPDSQTYDIKYLKLKLEERYGSDVFIVGEAGRPGLFCFKGFAEHVLSDKWYADRSDAQMDEAEKLVKRAGRLIASQIRDMPYSTDEYPDPDDISSDGRNVVPPLLLLFLQQLVHDDKKSAAISQAIIQAARPRTCLMPLLFGIGVELHRKYAMTQVVQQLARCSFSISLDEVTRYLQSVMTSFVGWNPKQVENSQFTQFVADNVDHNIRTVDGHETFHGMGIISVSHFGPGVQVAHQPRIPRSKARITKREACMGKSIATLFYNRKHGAGLETYMLKPMQNPATLLTTPVVRSLNTLWHAAGLPAIGEGRRPMWSGYMQSICEGHHPVTSKVLMLPILDLNPSDMTCVRSVLGFVSKQASLLRMPSTCVTFDQPLYSKAIDIVIADDLNVVVRLGGFHTLMNFMGAVGHIMRGSGLESALECIFGRSTVEHIMTGRAYARGVRGHLLIHSALLQILLCCLVPGHQHSDLPLETVSVAGDVSSLILKCEHVMELQELFQNTLEHKVQITEPVSIDDDSDVLSQNQFVNSESLEALDNSLHGLFSMLSSQSRTARLWLQYIRHIEIMKAFIAAERTSNWDMHLHAFQAMLPVFAAAHRFNYARSGRVYLQQMQDLPTTHPWLYKQFKDGMFTVRKTDRLWPGLSTDLVIEQDMMREIKGRGGLTRGRGLTDTTRMTWLNTLLQCTSVIVQLRKVTGFQVSAAEHVDVSQSRMRRDASDLEKLTKFFTSNSPFRYADSFRLVSLASGIAATADDNVTCDETDNIGSEIMERWSNITYKDMTLPKRDMVRTLANMYNTYRFDDGCAEIDANILFHRLVVLAQQQASVAEQFAYELTPYPAALFKDGYMRKPVKSNLCTSLASGLMDAALPTASMFVVDGGCLLHRIPWTRGSTLEHILQQYVQYVSKNFGQSAQIVFDGYSAGSPTKEHEHRRRTGKAAKVAPYMQFYINTLVMMDKQSVLANVSNKEQIVQLLSQQFTQSGFAVHQADDDADADIVRVALQAACTNIAPVAVAADDTDILAMLLYHWKPTMSDVFFFRIRAVAGSAFLFVYFKRRLELTVASKYSCYTHWAAVILRRPYLVTERERYFPPLAET